MKYSSLESIEILKNNEIFDERENEKTHTSYETELMFYSCIKNGDVDRTVKMMQQLFANKVITGKLSDNNLMQIKYWSVCCITLAVRYAIQGGVDETFAFNFSDSCIINIDKMEKEEDVFKYLQDVCIEITTLVAKNKKNNDYPYKIKKCIHFINVNLHNKISLQQLADETHLSADYLSYLFKKCVGTTITDYIRHQKLLAAKVMLKERKSCSEISYYLNFCSESYFIKCFKKEFGITPKVYAENMG